jgi:hypothetical protein
MMDPDPQSRGAVADAAHALHRIYAQNRTDRTREETAAFGRGTEAAGVAATTQAHPAPDPDPTLEPTPAPTLTPEPRREAAAEPRPAPAAAPRRSRRGRSVLLVCGVLAVLVILGALGAFLLDDGPSAPASDSTEPSADASSSEGGNTGGGTSSGDTNGGNTDSDAPAAGTPEEFVSDYYAVLPDDTRTGWSMLTPGFQSEVGSYEDYDGFWSTIDAVTVEDVQAAGPGAVDATLVYTTDGSSEREVRRIELTRGSEGYLISGDDVVG